MVCVSTGPLPIHCKHFPSYYGRLEATHSVTGNQAAPLHSTGLVTIPLSILLSRDGQDYTAILSTPFPSQNCQLEREEQANEEIHPLLAGEIQSFHCGFFVEPLPVFPSPLARHTHDQKCTFKKNANMLHTSFK